MGNTLRIQVTATNKNGSTIARSAPTAVIAKAPLPSGATISINDVALPNRLMIDRYSFTPSPLRSHRTIIARFHVSDTRNHNVMGALVFAEDIPLGQTTRPAEQATGPDGWVTFAHANKETTCSAASPPGGSSDFRSAKRPTIAKGRRPAALRVGLPHVPT